MRKEGRRRSPGSSAQRPDDLCLVPPTPHRYGAVVRNVQQRPVRVGCGTQARRAACDRGGAPSVLAAPAFWRSSSTAGGAGWRGLRVREAFWWSACSTLTVVRAECRTDRGTSPLLSAVSPAV